MKTSKPLYHCGLQVPSGRYVEDDCTHITREIMNIKFLCGATMRGDRSQAWDPPHYFVNKRWRDSFDHEVCPECENHSDLPLLLLGGS